MDTVFATAYKDAVISLKEDPLNHIFPDSTIPKIADQFQDNAVALKFFKDLFVDIFNTNSNLCLSHDREVIFAKLHQVRLSEKVSNINKIMDVKYSEMDIQNFVQMLLLELVNQLLYQQVKHEKKNSEVQQSTITENDQNVLFYITGYVIRSCTKRYNRLKNTNCDKEMKLKLMQKVQLTPSSESTFVSKYKKWTNKKNRGGLILPSDNFFLMIREFEMICRNNTDTSICASTLYRTRLQELCLESFMVKYYCQQVFTDYTTDNYINVLEDIIKLFLTIRGYSVARIQRNIMMKDIKDSKKSSSSLRQALKAKNSNVPL